MRPLHPALLAALAGLVPAEALAATHEGKYTFNWFQKPESQRCIRIGATLAAQMASKAFQCRGEQTNTEHGVPAAACTNRARGIEYLIFRTRAHCEGERKAQASNSED